MRSWYVFHTNNHRALVKETNEEVIVVEGLRRGRPTLIYLFILISHFLLRYQHVLICFCPSICTLSIVCYSLRI